MKTKTHFRVYRSRTLNRQWLGSMANELGSDSQLWKSESEGYFYCVARSVGVKSLVGVLPDDSTFHGTLADNLI